MGKSVVFDNFDFKSTFIPRKISHIDEPELLARIISRDHAAFEYLYDHYSPALYGVIYRILRNEAFAEEVLQDTFLKIWDRIGQYDVSRGRLFTWIVNIARNLAIDKIRSKEISRNKQTNSLEALVSSVNEESSVVQKTDDIGVKELLRTLTEDQQFVIEYLYFKGYSQSELAEDFHIPLGTIKTRLRAALQKLRTIFF